LPHDYDAVPLARSRENAAFAGPSWNASLVGSYNYWLVLLSIVVGRRISTSAVEGTVNPQATVTVVDDFGTHEIRRQMSAAVT
jgi:hypothetical protein